MSAPSGPGGPTFGQPAPAGGGESYNRSGAVTLTANSSGYQSSMGAATKVTNELLSSVVALYTHVDQLFKIGGRSLQIMAAGDVALLGHAASNAADLQAQMSTLRATAEVNSTSMATYDKAVDNTFSKFPAHRADVVALVTEITNLGVKGKAIENVATSMEKLGAASGENIPSLTNDLVLLNRQMGGTGATNIAGYANAVLTLSKNAGTSVGSILSFGQAIAPISRLAHIGQSAVLGISTAFSKAGADGYYAANTFNSILTDITVATRTGSPDLAKYANFVGVTVDHFRRMPAKQQITDIFEAIGRGGPRALNFVNELGLGTRGLTAVQAVAQQGGLRRYINEAIRSSGGTDNLNRGADAALSGLDATLGRLHNQFTRFEDLLGAPLLAPLTGLASGFTMLLTGVNDVVSHLGPLPTLLAAVAAPLTLIAGIGLSHAGLVAGAALIRTMTRSDLPGAFVAGRQTQMVMRGGMGAEEAMAATVIGSQVAGPGRNLLRTRAAFGLGRARGMLGDSAASMEDAALATEGAAGASLLSRGAGRLVGGAMRLPSYLIGQQTGQIRDARAGGGFASEAYRGTAEGAPPRTFAVGTSGVAQEKLATASTRAASAEEAQAGVIGNLTRGTWNLVKAFADLGLETAKYSVVLAGQGVQAVGRGASSSVMGRAAAGEAAALARLNATEVEHEAVAVKTTAGVAAAHEMEAKAVVGAAETETIALTNLQRLRARTFGMVPTGAVGKAFGLMLGGQLVGSMVDNGSKGSGRNIAGTAISDAAMGAAIASFLPFGGMGMALAAGIGGVAGIGSATSRTPTTVPAPAIRAFTASSAGTGSGQKGFGQLRSYLEKAGLFKALPPGQMGMSEDQLVRRFLSDPKFRDEMLQLEGPSGIDPNSALTSDQIGNIKTALGNYKGGTATGLRQFTQRQQQIANASPLANAITGTPLFRQVAYGSLSGNIGAQNRLIEQSAQTAIAMAGSAGKASTELQKLGDAAGGAAGQLLQNAAAYARMIQGFNLPYMSREQRLSTLTQNAVSSRRIAQAPGATDYDKQQATADQQALAQEKQSYTQYLQSVFTATREFHVGQIRAQEDYNTSLYRSNRNFQIQMQQSEHDYLLNRSRQLQDFNISQARAAQSAAENIYDPFHTVQVQQVVNGGILVANLEDQNRRILAQHQQLEQLRRAGLSQGAIDTLRLSDPSQAQQVNSIAESVLNDPATIARINRLIAVRQKATTGLVQSNFNEDFRNTMADFSRGLSRAATDYNTARDRAVQAQNIALGDMSFDFNRMVTRSGEDLTRQMTELYGSFAQNYTRTLKEINLSIGKEVPKLADKLINEITNAEGRITAAATGGVPTGGGPTGTPSGARGSAGNPITKAGTVGVNAAGKMGEYTASGKFVPENMTIFNQLSSAQQKTIRSRHIAPPGSNQLSSLSGEQRYAAGLFGGYGWKQDQMNSLIPLWNRESGWSPTADTRVTGAGGDNFAGTGPLQHGDPHMFAYGIAQARPPSKYSKAGRPPDMGGSADPAAQIRWGLAYINTRYHTPAKALEHENTHGWYHAGGIFTGKQIIGVGDVPQGEAVLPMDARGLNFMISFYDRVTTALAQRITGGGGGQPGLRGTGGPTYIHEDYRTVYTGDIAVGANDPADMERKLAARARLKRLASPARQRG